nr:hypothetical protein [Tanacetum cinerariifolium]
MNEEEMFRVNDFDSDEVIMDATAGEEVEQSIKVAEKEVSTADPVTTVGEVVTTAEDVEVIVQEPSEFRTTSSSQPSQLPQATDKGKGIMVEPEKTLKKKDQIAFDKEVARNLEAEMKAEMKEEERIAREKDEANMDMIEQWDEVQAKTLLEKKRKLFARKREIEKRNRPLTKSQQRNLICTYLKNMDR